MARLGDTFVLIRNGASIKQTEGSGGIPITRIETISDRQVNRTKFGYAGIFNIQKFSDYILQDNDILMSHINSEKHLGKAAIYQKQGDEQIIHGMNLLMLRANFQVIWPKYALYYFETPFFQQQITKITRKSVNQASFTVTSLKEISIPLPPIEKQQNIARLLDKLTDLIFSRKQQLAKLDELVKVRFMEMFEGKNYPLVCISDVVDRNILPAKKKFIFSDIIKYVDISSIDNQRNVMTGFTEYVFSSAPSRAQQCIKEGDILISTVRPNLRNIAQNYFKDFNMVASSGFCVLRPKLCCSSYLRAAVLSDEFTDAMTKVTTGANYPAIKSSDVLGYKIPLAPDHMQQDFDDFSIKIDEFRLTIQQSLDKLEILKKSLMQEYFGGEGEHAKL